MPKLIPFSKEYQAGVLDFWGRCFPESNRVFEPDGRHQPLKDIEANFLRFWLLLDEGEIIGTVGVRRLEKENACELKSLYLSQKFYGLGYGRNLLFTALNYAKSAGFSWVYLDTRSDSQRALRLYEKAGFQKTAPYYENPLTDLFFRLDLTQYEEKSSI